MCSWKGGSGSFLAPRRSAMARAGARSKQGRKRAQGATTGTNVIGSPSSTACGPDHGPWGCTQRVRGKGRREAGCQELPGRRISWTGRIGPDGPDTCLRVRRIGDNPVAAVPDRRHPRGSAISGKPRASRSRKTSFRRLSTSVRDSTWRTGPGARRRSSSASARRSSGRCGLPPAAASRMRST